MAGNKGMTHYAREVKLEAVRLLEEEGPTYAQIAGRLGLRKASLAEAWCYEYRKQGPQAFENHSGRPRKTDLSEAERIARLEMENALLKKFHTELRKITLARRDIGSSSTTEESTP